MMPGMEPPRPARVLAAVVDLALPRACAGCGCPGPAVCPGCRAAVRTGPGGPRPVAPTPCPDGFPPTWASAPYAGTLARWVVAFKDGDRRDLLGHLAPLLAGAVQAAVTGCPAAVDALGLGGRPVLLVPVPTSRTALRRRGDHPLDLLARRVAADYHPAELVLARALRLRRRVADQAGLTASERRVNLAGAFVVPRRTAADVSGACCVLVDDVVTTGATLVEAATALRESGAVAVVAATVAATARRAGRSLSIGRTG